MLQITSKLNKCHEYVTKGLFKEAELEVQHLSVEFNSSSNKTEIG